jgi:hypothetical protein
MSPDEPAESGPEQPFVAPCTDDSDMSIAPVGEIDINPVTVPKASLPPVAENIEDSDVVVWKLTLEYLEQKIARLKALLPPGEN